LRVVDGVLPAALAAADAGRKLIVPAGNGAEAALASQVEAYTARTLLEVCAMLTGSKTLPAAVAPARTRTPGADLRDVRGQAHARRALEVAAAGGHHLLLIGPPGCGKSLLASRLPGLLPDASEEEALESAAIASISGRGLDPASWVARPFRAPHHTASAVALVGGGADPRPGEISLAHHGVLFLDELPEWERRALEVLREPLESGVVTVSRAARSQWPLPRQPPSREALPRPCIRPVDGPDRPARGGAAPAAVRAAARCARRRAERGRAPPRAPCPQAAGHLCRQAPCPAEPG